jgi:hypothetical protein
LPGVGRGCICTGLAYSACSRCAALLGVTAAVGWAGRVVKSSLTSMLVYIW